MEFELEFFEEFIQKERALHNLYSQHSAVQDFPQKKKLIEDEVQRIKRSFRNFLFRTECESLIENVIQHHQLHIISLADQVIKCIDDAEAAHMTNISDGQTKFDLCLVMFKALEDLLKYIEKYFSKYFKQDEKIPLAYALMAEKEISEKLRAIEEGAKNKELDARLLEIALYPATDFVRNKSKKKFTFRRLIYLKQLVADIKTTLERPSGKMDDVFGLLFYLNFNTYYFLTYTTDKISKEVRELTTLVQQIERLSFWVKLLNQNTVKPDFALKRDRPSIQEQLGMWLGEEIHFIEKKKQLTLLMPPSGPITKPDGFKVNTNLSVPQLAYFIRLLKDVGIITNQNQTELIRFFSQHFSSSKNKNISSESLRIKYYNAERSSIHSIQSTLDRLLAHSKLERH